MKAKKQKKNPVQTQPAKSRNQRLPFIEHLLELRRRLFYVALSVIAFGTGAYFVQQHIVAFLLKPAQHQQFIYTSVGGGIDFLFRVCIYAGIACSIPVIVFQILQYLAPLMKRGALRFILWGSTISGVLAVAGVLFGYFLGLPTALHFLLHQFTSDQIHPLLTIQSYMSFVTLYLLGSALLFQLPLILVLINRAKPLKPKKLLGYERWVILLAFVAGGIMNPSPRVQDQLLLAVPVILAYQVGIFLVWMANRHGRRETIDELRAQDAQARTARQSQFTAAQAALQRKMAAAPVTAAHKPQPKPVHWRPAPVPQPAGPRRAVSAHVPVSVAAPLHATKAVDIAPARHAATTLAATVSAPASPALSGPNPKGIAPHAPLHAHASPRAAHRATPPARPAVRIINRRAFNDFTRPAARPQTFGA